jgi:outer membrane protein insertion porin family
MVLRKRAAFRRGDPYCPRQPFPVAGERCPALRRWSLFARLPSPSRTLAFALAAPLLLAAGVSSWGQKQAAAVQNPVSSRPEIRAIGAPPAPAALAQSTRTAAHSGIPAEAIVPDGAPFDGMTIRRVAFEGVPASRLKPYAGQIEARVGQPLTADFLRASLRRLYVSGLFDTMEVAGVREAGGVALIFRGQPRMFIGIVGVDGAKGATVNTQLERAAELNPGTHFTPEKLARALEQMRQTLAANGYDQPVIQKTVTPRTGEQLVDIIFHVMSGPRARIGKVELTGSPGMSLGTFRHQAHLRAGAHVDHDTVNRALDSVLKHYQKQERLEADVKLESQDYVAASHTVNYRFSAIPGPVVHVEVEGASLENDQIRRLIPVYEEGTVDEDLLNEGNRRLRDYFQRLGHFDVKVTHRQERGEAGALRIVFTVQLGPSRKVQRVRVAGNRYFDSDTLEDLLGVHAAGLLDRHGSYSQALVANDVSTLEAVYRNNGFSQVKVTPSTSPARSGSSAPAKDPPATDRSRGLDVTYHIDEGPQMRVGTVTIEGNAHLNAGLLTPLLNTESGQLLSPRNLAGDRDALLTMYLSRGFNQVGVDIAQQPHPGNPNLVDVSFRIHEGEQVFVRDVLLTGIHYTRMQTVAPAITLHANDPLSQASLLDTQRNLYEFALFNEVNTAVVNPDGAEPYKTVLINAIEARRWALTYGFGFEAQTGQPQNNCAGATAGGVACNPNGKTGVSPRVIADITRNNLFGREQSASLTATYGLLEQRIQLLYQVPHFEGFHNIGLNFSGGYANSQDVTTYVASRLDSSFRWSQSFNPGGILSPANTFVYEYNFRRVKVAAGSLQVYPGAIAELATAVRVAGPSFTWIRDTRDSAMDAHRGTNTSLQEFLSDSHFGAEAAFNRIDLSNSSYYGFDKGRIVLARNTRYGQVRSFGSGFSGQIPLPERLYAGGPISLRGFPVNAAGPRDPETGYPIGGAGALINSTELRLPPTPLPWLGDTVSFVLFHDMGNVFTDAGNMWESALRIHQPNRDACKVLTPGSAQNPPTPTGPSTSTGVQGQCNFNYFSHAPGIGVRYHTPVGPIRLDFSYNLNPPIYPVNIDYSLSNPYSDPHVGESPHFNFFFSLGQTF